MQKSKNLILALTALVAVVGLNSCDTQKRMQRLCSKCPEKIVRYDSIVEKLRDTTIYLPGSDGPVVFLENPCAELCDSFGNLRNIAITKTKNGQVVKINRVGNSIAIATNTKDTTAKVTVKDKQSISKSESVVPRLIPCDRDHRTSFDGFCRWWFWITAGCLAIYFGWRYVKKYFKAG